MEKLLSETRVCSKCGIEKSLMFYSKNGRGGLRPNCKQCDAINRKKKLVKFIQPLEEPVKPLWYHNAELIIIPLILSLSAYYIIVEVMQ